MNVNEKLYGKLVRNSNTNTNPANRHEVEEAICELCEYWKDEAEVLVPKRFIWFDSPLAASRFIDANATVTRNGARWKGWDFIDGARPSFHCGWGAYYSYIVSAMSAFKVHYYQVNYLKIQEALLQAGPWYLFEEAAVCIDTPEEVELDDSGFITYILYRDGVEYTMTKEGDKESYPPRFSPEYSLKETFTAIDNFPLGECITERVTNLDDCATAIASGSSWLNNVDVQKIREFGRRSMFSMNAMNVSTVSCVLDKRAWSDCIEKAMKKIGPL